MAGAPVRWSDERRQRAARQRRGSACSTTGPTRPAGTPPSRTPWPTRSTRPARPSASRSSPASLRSAPDELYDALGTLDALVVTVLAAGGSKPATAQRRRRRRGLGRRADGRARHPGPAGAVPDQQPRGVGGLRRRRDAARLGHPDRDPGVRRPDHHRAVLVQGDRRGRAAALRRRPRALRPGRRDRGQPRPAAAHPDERAQDRADALGVPDQALPRRQRRRPRHPGLDGPAAAPDARRGLRPRRARRDPGPRPRRRHRGRRRADPRADRRRRPGRGVADQRPAHRRARADHQGRLRRLDRRRAGRADGRHGRGVGRGARASCSSTTPARSCSPRSRPATSCC